MPKFQTPLETLHFSSPLVIFECFPSAMPALTGLGFRPAYVGSVAIARTHLSLARRLQQL